MDGTAVNRQDHAKDLSVLLKQHIDDVVARGNQLLGVVIRTTNELVICNPMCIKAIYNCIVRSVLELSCVVWSPTTASSIARLEVIHRNYTHIDGKELYFPLFNSGMISIAPADLAQIVTTHICETSLHQC